MKKSENPLLIFLAFFAIYFVWGTTYLAALFGLEGMKPFVICTLRYCTAGLLLLGWCLFKGQKLNLSLFYLKTCSVSGILMLVGGTGLVVYAEQYVSSGEAAVIIATEPIFFLLIDRKRWKTYFSNPVIIGGIIIGFGGTVLFAHYTGGTSQSPLSGREHLLGILILLAGAVFWVLGALYGRNRFKPGESSNIINSAVQLISAGIFSGFVALFAGEWKAFNPAHTPLKAWGGLLFLIIMGSLVAYLAYTWLITIRPPALISAHTYVNPVVAIFMGWIFAGENISVMQILSLAVILTGVLMVNLPGYKSPEKIAEKNSYTCTVSSVV